MEKIAILSRAHAAKSYCMLTKPGIILGNAMTAAGAFVLASKGQIDPFLFLATLFGLSLIMGSACVFNNYIDREADAKMLRTQNRSLARGDISANHALLFGAVIGLLGAITLSALTNLLCLSIALFGFVIYVLVYSFLKYRSTYATLIGSVAGAVPPVVGYCAVNPHVDLAAWVLFGIIVTWQMPHFFAIAIYRLNDYREANIPVLPIQKGILRTKIHMLFYIIGFIVVSSLLTIFGYTGDAYLFVALILGVVWLIIGLRGFKSANDAKWARKMFLFSLIIITVQFFAIALGFTVNE